MKMIAPNLEPTLKFRTDDFFGRPEALRPPVQPKEPTRRLSPRTQAILAALDTIHAGRQAGLAQPTDPMPAEWPHDSWRMHAKVVAIVTVGMAWPIFFDMPRPTRFGLLSGFLILAFSLVRGYRLVSEGQQKTERAQAQYHAAQEQAWWVETCRALVEKVKAFPHGRVLETAADVIACVPVLQRLLAKREAVESHLVVPSPH